LFMDFNIKKWTKNFFLCGVYPAGGPLGCGGGGGGGRPSHQSPYPIYDRYPKHN